MLITQRKKTTTGRLIGAVAGLALITAIAWYARAHDHPDFARGVIAGGVFAIGLGLLAGFFGKRGPTLMRVLGGMADERERALLQRASAHGALAMFMAASVFAIFFPEATAVSATAVVLWAGLIVITTSFIVQARRD